MDEPLTGETPREIPTESHPQATQSATEQQESVDPASDADTMMRTIIGSISVDPDDVRRRIEKNGRPLSTAEKEVNIRLVILAVALVFLVFGLDLVFMKM